MLHAHPVHQSIPRGCQSEVTKRCGGAHEHLCPLRVPSRVKAPFAALQRARQRNRTLVAQRAALAPQTLAATCTLGTCQEAMVRLSQQSTTVRAHAIVRAARRVLRVHRRERDREAPWDRWPAALCDIKARAPVDAHAPTPQGTHSGAMAVPRHAEARSGLAGDPPAYRTQKKNACAASQRATRVPPEYVARCDERRWHVLAARVSVAARRGSCRSGGGGGGGAALFSHLGEHRRAGLRQRQRWGGANAARARAQHRMGRAARAASGARSVCSAAAQQGARCTRIWRGDAPCGHTPALQVASLAVREALGPAGSAVGPYAPGRLCSYLPRGAQATPRFGGFISGAEHENDRAEVCIVCEPGASTALSHESDPDSLRLDTD